MGLLQIIGEAKQQELDRATARYGELLAAEGEGNSKAAAELRSLMELLGKTVEEAHVDKGVIDRAKNSLQGILQGKGLDGAREKAEKAAEAYRQETLRIAEERRAELAKLQSAAALLSSRYTSGQSAFHTLKGMKDQNRQLLASISMPDSFN